MDYRAPNEPDSARLLSTNLSSRSPGITNPHHGGGAGSNAPLVPPPSDRIRKNTQHPSHHRHHYPTSQEKTISSSFYGDSSAGVSTVQCGVDPVDTPSAHRTHSQSYTESARENVYCARSGLSFPGFFGDTHDPAHAHAHAHARIPPHPNEHLGAAHILRFLESDYLKQPVRMRSTDELKVTQSSREHHHEPGQAPSRDGDRPGKRTARDRDMYGGPPRSRDGGVLSGDVPGKHEDTTMEGEAVHTRWRRHDVEDDKRADNVYGYSEEHAVEDGAAAFEREREKRRSKVRESLSHDDSHARQTTTITSGQAGSLEGEDVTTFSGREGHANVLGPSRDVTRHGHVEHGSGNTGTSVGDITPVDGAGEDGTGSLPRGHVPDKVHPDVVVHTHGAHGARGTHDPKTSSHSSGAGGPVRRTSSYSSIVSAMKVNLSLSVHGPTTLPAKIFPVYPSVPDLPKFPTKSDIEAEVAVGGFEDPPMPPTSGTKGPGSNGWYASPLAERYHTWCQASAPARRYFKGTRIPRDGWINACRVCGSWTPMEISLPSLSGGDGDATRVPMCEGCVDSLKANTLLDLYPLNGVTIPPISPSSCVAREKEEGSTRSPAPRHWSTPHGKPWVSTALSAKGGPFQTVTFLRETLPALKYNMDAALMVLHGRVNDLLGMSTAEMAMTSAAAISVVMGRTASGWMGI